MYTRKCIYQRQDPEDRLKVLGPSNIPLHIEKKKFKSLKLKNYQGKISYMYRWAMILACPFTFINYGK